MDYSAPDSFVQARILECVAISFSRGSSESGIKSTSPALAGGFFTTEPPGKPHYINRISALKSESASMEYGNLNIYKI